MSKKRQLNQENCLEEIKFEETCLDGVAISPGIAIGKPFVSDCFQEKIPEFEITAEQIEKEIRRYRKALEDVRKDLLNLQQLLQKEGNAEVLAVFEAQLQITQDPLFNQELEAEIGFSRKNAECILQKFVGRLEKKFLSFDDPFFQLRFEDIKDIYQRMLDCLKKQKKSFAEIPFNSIVFAAQITPSDVAMANSQQIAAFVTKIGGNYSHTAIVAKARAIPYICNVDFLEVDLLHQVSSVIVDGHLGRLILNPTEKTCDKYRLLQLKFQKKWDVTTRTRAAPCKTLDGEMVSLLANIEMPKDFDLPLQYNAKGVGLFRTEYLVLERGSFPNEEEQFLVYRELARKMAPHPVVIRAFDIGRDKVISSGKASQTLQNAMSSRSIRFLLQEKEVFQTQLQALLRASEFGKVCLLLPMITGSLEFLEAKKMLQQASIKLGIQAIPLGCMIELPSAAMQIKKIARECDFFSIGTNDLLQYSLAIDRTNKSKDVHYSSFHPSFLLLLKEIISDVNKVGKQISICGEIASDPLFVPLLLGFNIRELSVPCRLIPHIRQIIRKTSFLDATKLANLILNQTDACKVKEILCENYQKIRPLA